MGAYRKEEIILCGKKIIICDDEGIEEIVDTFVYSEIDTCEISCSYCGMRMQVEGCVEIKLHYISCCGCKPLLAKVTKIPFCKTIYLPDDCYDIIGVGASVGCYDIVLSNPYGINYQVVTYLTWHECVCR